MLILLFPSFQRRQVSIVSESSEDGPLKRSYSQHVYKPAENGSSSSFFDSSNMNGSANHGDQSHNSSVFFDSSSASLKHAAKSNGMSEDRYAALSSLFTDVIPESSDSGFASNGGTTSSNGGTSSLSQSTSSHNNHSSGDQSSSSVSNGYNTNSLSKSMSSSNVLMGPPLAIPRPPSKKMSMSQAVPSSPSYVSSSNMSAFSASTAINNGNQSVMQRCKSYGSLTSSDFNRMTPISMNSVGSSRGPSPLTIGFSDTIPVAIALQESISARFKGTDESRCQTQMFGSLKIAFPAGIVQVLFLQHRSMCK